VSVYAAAPNVDRRVIEALASGGGITLFSALALGDEATSARLLAEKAGTIDPGVLHLLAKRGDARAVKWLLDRGADPNARWSHWEAVVTPLHLALLGRHADIVRLLLSAGADPTIRDSQFDSDAIGWAAFFQQPEMVELLKAHGAKS
jgi:ankyrin repeat protein